MGYKNKILKKVNKNHNYCLVKLRQACKTWITIAWVQDSKGETDNERKRFMYEHDTGLVLKDQ